VSGQASVPGSVSASAAVAGSTAPPTRGKPTPSPTAIAPN
jgi:hypothetical protein